MPLNIKIENYRGLRQVDWTLEPGVSLLVGPNGSGKTTLLDVPALLRDATERGIRSAVDAHGGPGQIVNLRADAAAAAHVIATADDLRWELELLPQGAELVARQKVTKAGGQYLRKAELDMRPSALGIQTFTWSFRDEPGPIELSGETGSSSRGRSSRPVGGLLELAEASNTSPEMKDIANTAPLGVASLVTPLRGYRLAGGYWIRALRVRGSQASSDLQLDQEGTNAFSVLRNWLGTRATRSRWEFVENGLRAAFPDVFEELEFEAAGQTVSARIFAPGLRQSVGAYFAPDGLLSGLLHLTAVASAFDGGILAIDEFENSLHPYAIRALLEHIRAFTTEHGISLTLASHSPVLIDQFKNEPSRILVMDPTVDVLPVPIDRLRDREWLAHFSLGDLYAGGEFGAQARH